jgi:branched-chain amino acid transport system permease protein
MRFLLSVTFNICVYALLGISLNLPLGYGGMLFLCAVSFFGVGAYTYAIASHYRADLFFISIVATVLATAIATLIGFIAIRFRGDYFVIATLGFQVIINSVFTNWISLTGGPYGQRDIPSPRLGPWTLDSPISYVVLALVVLSLVIIFCSLLLKLPFGRSLVAVRDSEVGAIAFGKNPSHFRISALTIGAALAALAGVLYASHMTYIDPASFGLDEMMVILAVVIIGGAGTLYGPVVGATVIVILPELLKSLPLGEANAGAIRQIVFGMMIIVFMRLRPQGIAGRYRFSANM